MASVMDSMSPWRGSSLLIEHFQFFVGDVVDPLGLASAPVERALVRAHHQLGVKVRAHLAFPGGSHCARIAKSRPFGRLCTAPQQGGYGLDQLTEVSLPCALRLSVASSWYLNSTAS